MVYLLDEIVHFVFGTVHIFITKMRTLFYNLRKKYAGWKQYSPTKSFGQKELQWNDVFIWEPEAFCARVPFSWKLLLLFSFILLWKLKQLCPPDKSKDLASEKGHFQHTNADLVQSVKQKVQHTPEESKLWKHCRHLLDRISSRTGGHLDQFWATWIHSWPKRRKIGSITDICHWHRRMWGKIEPIFLPAEKNDKCYLHFLDQE